MSSQIFTTRRILEGVCAKNLESIILFVDSPRLLIPKEERANTTRQRPTQINHRNQLYRNTKVKVCFPHRDTGYFNIVEGVLQRNTLVPYLFNIYLDYVLRMFIDKIKDNSFKLAKERSIRYPAQTITDADYADGIALLVNTPAHVETLLHSLERAAAGIGLHINADKTEYTCFNKTGVISPLNGSFLKLVDRFTYLGSSVSSTEININSQRDWQLSIASRSYVSQSWPIK